MTQFVANEKCTLSFFLNGCVQVERGLTEMDFMVTNVEKNIENWGKMARGEMKFEAPGVSPTTPRRVRIAVAAIRLQVPVIGSNSMRHSTADLFYARLHGPRIAKISR